MGRHYLKAAILWILLTAIGEFLALRIPLFPTAAAEEARIIDSSFILLMILGIPVFTFVLAVLIYTLSTFRSREEAPEDGPPVHGRPAVALLWITITAGLAIYVIFNPGLKGLAELRANQRADLMVRVEGSRWFWKVTYPEYGITAREIVLPVHRRVRFEVTSVDVVHSFWVPAFRVKIDAVPGIVTRVFVTPTQTGTFQEDYHFRLQCAELCGLGHSMMTAPVTVLEQGEFDAWVGKAKP
ncbi:MAG: cytochrome c oxidase subunit II [Armatimonadota bacterium]|nr:cytochrome c oxidase subunit II [Armatimonadota bacterium]